MSYPGNPTVQHQHGGQGAIAAGGIGTVISGPNGIITQRFAMGCIPTANFGENIIMSGTPAGVKKPQSLYK
jgi:hypothetical protein